MANDVLQLIDFIHILIVVTMKIAILGAGAIGCYYGSRLSLAGNDVSFFMRGDREHVLEHGLEIKSILGDMRLESVQVPVTTHDVGPVDLVVLTWKTTSNKQLADILPPLVGPNTKVLTLQNGMGNAESLAAVVPKSQIYCGVCFISAFRTGPGCVKHLANGAISMAPGFSNPEMIESTQEIATVFKAAKIPVKVFPNAETIMWHKVIWNVPFNGISILQDGSDVLYILTTNHGEDKVRCLMQEVIDAAASRGHILSDSLIEKQIEITYAMGHYHPSSGIDFMNGRPVEFESIWKIPFELATEAGAVLPEWAALNMALEEKLSSRDSL